MAQKKVEVVVKCAIGSETCLEAWCDASGAEDFLGIEGVSFAKQHGATKWLVWVDPRYSREEVRQEIIAKFSTPIPDAFKEEA